MGCCSSASDPLLYSKRESPEGSINLHLQSRNINSIRESYTIIRTLGSGSLGCVYLVKDKRSGLERAAKELLKSLMNQNSLENFFNELTILNYLVSSKQDHPSIMRVYEIIETTTRIYLITEYLSGGQLFEKLVASEMITEKLAAKYLNDIVLGLNYCHRNNVIHRDIKPENLLLESDAPDAHLKLIDFGISSIYKSELSIIQASVGAVGYMAPERFKGFISTKSDIWSAGVILYTMLCGKPPFQAGTDHDTAKLITNCKLDLTDEIWENISLEAKTLLVKMLDKDPKLRPTAETILSDPWLFAYSRNTIRNELIDPMALENLSKFNVFCM